MNYLKLENRWEFPVTEKSEPQSRRVLCRQLALPIEDSGRLRVWGEDTVDKLTTLRSVLPARSKAVEQLETAGCETLEDLQQLIARFALTLRPGEDLRIDWLCLSWSAWQTLLWALEQTGFRWSDYPIDPARSHQERP